MAYIWEDGEIIYSLNVTVNEDKDTTRQFEVEAHMNGGALEDVFAEVLAENQEATSFVFVVTKVGKHG